MAFTEVERSICNKMAHDSAGLLAPAEAAKGAIRNQMSAIRAQLNSYVQSPQGVIDAATNQLRNSAGSVIPGTTESDVEKMLEMINKCLFLQDDEKLNNPVALGKSMTQSLFDKLNDYFNDVTSVPEYLLGKALSALEELYSNQLPGSSALSDLMKKADKLIQCLSTVCNGEYTSEVLALTNQTENLYNDFEMVSDPLDANYGKLNKDKLFSDASLIPGDIQKITSANDEVNSIKTQAKSAIDDLMSSTKIAKKAGIF
jgi:hypothetical protein